jgi:short-subunit dehydrogenase
MGTREQQTTSHGRATKGTAVVTGASSGLGAVFADRLASRGYDLILVARREDRLIALEQRLISQYGVSAKAAVTDLTVRADQDSLINRIGSDTSITMLVNDAGAAAMKPVTSIGDAEQDTMVHLNITALTRLTLAALPGFKERDRGTIINIGSSLSIYTPANTAVYSATKAYVMNFTLGLQHELAGTNVVVQLVLPAKTATEIWKNTGAPLASLDQASVMTAENCVDAALSGLDQGESVTFPSVEDYKLWLNFESARRLLFGATQTGKPASRYHIGLAAAHSSPR